MEREDELGAIAGLVDAVHAGRGGLLVVEGVAGIGKSRLLQAAADRAAERGVAVLSGRGSQLETDFPFGVARQLFEPVIRAAAPARRERLLTGGAEPARRLLVQPAHTTPVASTDEFPVIHGLYWLLANLGDSRPHLVVVDDAHWADEASQRFLAFAAARLTGLPLGVVAAVRSGDGPLAAPLVAMERQPETVTLRPRTLSARGIADLVQQSLGADADTTFVDACATATGGIPFYVRELLVELVRDGTEPTAANAPQIAEVRPDSVARAVVARLADLPVEAAAVAQGLAVLEDASGESLLAGVTGVGLDATRSAVTALRAAGVCAPDRLAFAHPIMGAAIHQDIPAAVRAEMHARAARLVHDTAGDVERVAAHLRRAAPGAGGWAVDALREAARLAGDRGGAVEAIALLRRADAEPMEAASRARLLLELGTAEWRAGMPESVERLRTAVDRSSNTPWRGEAAVAFGRALVTHGRLDEAAHLMAEAGDELATVSPEVALRLEVEFFLAARPTYAWQARAAEQIVELQRRLAGRDTPAARLLLGDSAMHDAQANQPASVVVERARRAWGPGDLPAVEPAGSLHYWPLVHALICAGDVDTAERAIQTLLAESRRQGSACGYAMARLLRTILGLRRGTLMEAEADALEALTLVGDHFPLGLPLAVGVAAEALVERGDADQAQEIVDANPIPPALVGPGFHDYYLAGRSYLHMAREREAEALDDLRQTGESLLRWSAPGPSVLAWRSRAALALIALGDGDEAGRLAREEVELAEAFGSAHTIGVALRAAGLVAADGDDPAMAVARLDRAVAVLDGTPFVLEAARALTDLGALLRRLGRADARDHLRRGLDLALRCGAVPLAGRARRELIASGARPRRPVLTGLDALTATERRTCQLAAQGLSNRHIAQQLFVTIKTVEAHLTTSYRKLGVTSRNQLPAQLGQPEPPSSGS